MDFFSSQEQARKKTGQLVALFMLAVLGIVAGIYTVLAVGYREMLISEARSAYPPVTVVDPGWWFADLLAGTLVGVGLLIALGSGFKTLSLRAGGSAIAESLGGQRIDPMTTDPNLRRLMNVVEEMAIAAGVPVPEVYLMAHEKQINAFAAGFRPDHAVIGVTQGTVDQLSREELQGVIAHEFSHIMNGDMRLNMRLVGILYGILLIFLIGRIVMRMAFFSGGGGNRKNNPLPLMAVAVVMMVLGYIGFLAGRLIKMAISRQREYLADAAAVQYTRNPDSIAGALKRIGASSMKSVIAHPNAEEASHMFFSNAAKFSFSSLFSTHPPLNERIRRVDPSFDGDFSAWVPPASRPAHPVPPPLKKKEDTDQWMRRAILTSVLATDRIMDSVGAPAREHMAAAQAMLSELPDPVRAMARDPFGARALVYALLLDDQEAVRTAQLRDLEVHADPGVWKELQALLPPSSGLPTELRLPLLDLCMPALRSLSGAESERLFANVDRLIHADERVDLFEYALQAVLTRGMSGDDAGSGVTSIYQLKGVESELSVILSILSRLGHDDEAGAGRAFDRAADLLRESGLQMTRLPESASSLDQMDQALKGLASASIKVRKQALAACLTCLSADGVATPKEIEIFRCIAAVINCPVPLWMGVAGDVPSAQLEAEHGVVGE